MSKEDSSQFFRLYKHPQWQKRRLEVMQAAGFRCQRCRSSEETLNVHHISYLKDRKPWEYDDSELMCLCRGCHEKVHRQDERLKEALHHYKVSILQCGESVEFVVGWLTAHAQMGPYRIKASDSDDWLAGFVDGSGGDTVSLDYDAMRELIDADDGFVDHEWVSFFCRESIHEMRADYIRRNGFYCPPGFPDWYVEKVRRMVNSCEEV